MCFSQDKGFRDTPYSFHQSLHPTAVFGEINRGQHLKIEIAITSPVRFLFAPVICHHDATVLHPKAVDLGFGSNNECRRDGSEKPAVPT